MSELTDLLFARPSFLEGIGRAIDLGATMQEYNTSPTPEQADAVALQSDWQAINEDMSAVMAMPHDDLEEFVSHDK